MTDWDEMCETIAELEKIEKELTYSQLCWRPQEGEWTWRKYLSI
jgi:hypothetical protein